MSNMDVSLTVPLPKISSRDHRYLRSASAREFLGKSIGMYLRHFGPLFVTMMLPVLPFDLIKIAFVKLIDPRLAFAAAVLSAFAAVFASSAMAVAGSDIIRGNKPSVRRAYRRIFSRVFLVVLVNSVLQVLAIAAPFVIAFIIGVAAGGGWWWLITIPGVILSFHVALQVMYATTISALEPRPGFVRALKRSADLGRGFRWLAVRTLFLVVLAVIVAWSATAFGAGMIIAAASGAAKGAQDVLSSIAALLVLRLVMPITSMATLLLYYDLRSRKEAFDPTGDEIIND